MKQNRTKHFETPDALRHDVHTLTEDAQRLFEATRESLDEKVQAAREQLAETIERGREMYSEVQEQLTLRARKANKAVHEHPYKAAFMALGVGAILGFLFGRRE